MSERIDGAIARRAKRLVYDILPFLEANDIKNFRIAGNSLNPGKYNDIDIFPASVIPWPQAKKIKGARALAETPNALTLQTDDGIPVQLCAYHHDALSDLVKSFDFAHIKVGVEVDLCILDEPDAFGIYYSSDYMEARVTGSTWFTGSKYPLSSLIRVSKYYAQDAMPRGAMIGSVLDTLIAVATRGFANYEDFKDQIDAVDLGLAADDQAGISYESLKKLFEILRKDK